jgi:hypothetical protein
MAATIGVTGLVTAASGTWNTLLSRLSVATFTLNEVGGEFDSTEFGSASGIVPRQYLPSLRTATVTLEGFSATPVVGVTGNIALASGYDVNMFDWDMTINQAAVETTDFNISAAWRTYTPGLQDWSGTTAGFIDGTTAISNITEVTAAPTKDTLTCTISSGNTLSGSVFTRGLNAAVQVADRNIVRYEYRGDSDLTVVGTDAILAANSGTMASLAAGSMVLTAVTSRTYTGSFVPTSFNIRVAQGELTRIRATGQLTGALSIA